MLTKEREQEIIAYFSELLQDRDQLKAENKELQKLKLDHVSAFCPKCYFEFPRSTELQRECNLLREKLEVAVEALENIYADGSYKDIASDFAKEALAKIRGEKDGS